MVVLEDLQMANTSNHDGNYVRGNLMHKRMLANPLIYERLRNLQIVPAMSHVYQHTFVAFFKNFRGWGKIEILILSQELYVQAILSQELHNRDALRMLGALTHRNS